MKPLYDYVSIKPLENKPTGSIITETTKDNLPISGIIEHSGPEVCWV